MTANGPSPHGTTVTGPGRGRTTIVRSMTTIRLPLSEARAHRRTRAGNRTIRRLSSDPHALLAVGLVATTMAVAAFGRGDDSSRAIAISIEFLAAQAIAAVVAPYLRPSPRQLLFALLFHAVNGLRITLIDFFPSLAARQKALSIAQYVVTAALFIPIVALAAAQGARQALLVGAAAVSLYLLPVFLATPDSWSLDAQRAIALGGTAILLSIGTRRSISALTVTVRRLGASLARDRRRSRQVAAVESVGRLLATTGPAPATLEGQGLSAACYALAGKIDSARAIIDRLAEADRYRAAGIVFDIAHPVADAGDNRSAGPIMELVISYWPNHYMALYHAGMAEFALGEADLAAKNLTAFLKYYHENDGWTQSARATLAQIAEAR